MQEGGFEKYLEKVCFEANPSVLDDDMPDFFNDWLGNQGGEDYIRLADEYSKYIVQSTCDEIARRVKEETIEEVYKDMLLIEKQMERFRNTENDFDRGQYNAFVDAYSILKHTLSTLNK